MYLRFFIILHAICALGCTLVVWISGENEILKRAVSVILVEFGKIISIERTELCFLNVQMGNMN